jgi:hypothetical protein
MGITLLTYNHINITPSRLTNVTYGCSHTIRTHTHLFGVLFNDYLFQNIPKISFLYFIWKFNKIFKKSFWLTKMLHYTIIVKFDLNNVPKICHLNSIKESFMSFSSAKNTHYIAKKNAFGYSIPNKFFSNFSSVSIMY